MERRKKRGPVVCDDEAQKRFGSWSSCGLCCCCAHKDDEWLVLLPVRACVCLQTWTATMGRCCSLQRMLICCELRPQFPPWRRFVSPAGRWRSDFEGSTWQHDSGVFAAFGHCLCLCLGSDRILDLPVRTQSTQKHGILQDLHSSFLLLPVV